MQSNDFEKQLLQSFDKVSADLEKIREEGNFIPDPYCEQGYESSKRFVLDITTKARTALEKRHKEVKAPLLELSKKVDAKKNDLMNSLKAIEKPHLEAYKAVDAERKAKRDEFDNKLSAMISAISELSDIPFGLSSEEIADRLCEVGEIDTQEGFYHRSKEAAEARAKSLQILENALNIQVAIEHDRAELEKLRANAPEPAPAPNKTEESIDEMTRELLALVNEIEGAEINEIAAQAIAEFIIN